MSYITRFGELFLHDQKGDAVDTRYSVQTEAGGILFLFNESDLTAREVFETFALGADLTIKTAARGEPMEDEIERLHEALKVADAALCEARTFIASRADEGWAWLDQSRATIRAALSAADGAGK